MTVGELIDGLLKHDMNQRIAIGVHSAASHDETDAGSTHGYSTNVVVTGNGDDETAETVFLDVYGVEMNQK